METKFWELIESANWTKDHDYHRIQNVFGNLDENVFKMLKAFVDEKMANLATRFKSDWLANPGIEVSDDGWMDLRAEVIGRGKIFYENITVAILQQMANTDDYTECFIYCFNID